MAAEMKEVLVVFERRRRPILLQPSEDAQRNDLFDAAKHVLT